MPSDRIGIMCSLASVVDPDARYADYIWVRVTAAHRTINSIAAARDRRDLALQIAQLNGIRDTYKKLKIGRLIRLPGTLKQGLFFDVHFQDEKRPFIKDGYAMFDVLDREGEKGITHFKGYNPLAMDLAVTFEGWMRPPGGAGGTIEERIQALERMAGRGPFSGAATGPPAIIRVSVTDNYSQVVPLIPYSYQWNGGTVGTGLLWRINGLDWDDAAKADRNGSGERARADCTIHLVEHTAINLTSTVTQRGKLAEGTFGAGGALANGVHLG